MTTTHHDAEAAHHFPDMGERVVRLANDIAAQFSYPPPDEAARMIAAHIKKFWEPRMLEELAKTASRPENGLTSRAQQAAQLLAGLVSSS